MVAVALTSPPRDDIAVPVLCQTLPNGCVEFACESCGTHFEDLKVVLEHQSHCQVASGSDGSYEETLGSVVEKDPGVSVALVKTVDPNEHAAALAQKDEEIASLKGLVSELQQRLKSEAAEVTKLKLMNAFLSEAVESNRRKVDIANQLIEQSSKKNVPNTQ